METQNNQRGQQRPIEAHRGSQIFLQRPHRGQWKLRKALFQKLKFCIPEPVQARDQKS